MFNTIARLLKLLTPKQKREFFLLQGVMIASSVAELIGTVSIMPFIALAANPDVLEKDHRLGRLSELLGNPGHEDMLIYVGCIFFLLLVFANCLLFLSQFLMSRYSLRLAAEISTRLYGFYLSQDIIYHSRTNSAKLNQRLMRDSHQVCMGLIAPGLRLNAHFFSILLLTGLVVYLDALVAASSLIVLAAVYWLIFRVIRGAITHNGRSISLFGQQRTRLLNESFGGIKDMKLNFFESRYLRDYRQITRATNRATADNQILGEFPYYLVETVLFGGMVLLTLYLASSENGLHSTLPLLTLFAMAGVKLVPKIQQSYKAITQIGAAQPVFEAMYDDLQASFARSVFSTTAPEKLSPKNTFGLRNITFGYGEHGDEIFKDFSLQIPIGQITAIVGPSGSGKSTLLDIMMGLIKPSAGCIEVDGRALHERDLPTWRFSIGYVTQDVYLTDTTSAENIAFGVTRDELDMERVQRAAGLARIADFIEGLPEGYQSRLGERGSQLSGGQKQRIGIARALYRGASILFLDEATSALDTETQAEILHNLKSSEDRLTIVMVSHRKETIEIADRVIELSGMGDVNSPSTSPIQAVD